MTEEVRYDSEFLTNDIITYQYNVDGLLTAKSYDLYGKGTVDRFITYEYDEQGRVILRTNDTLNTGEFVNFVYYSYDNEGRLAGFSRYFYYDNGALSSTGTYVYDENNVRTELYFNYLDGSTKTLSYLYNEAGELETTKFGSAYSKHYLFEDGPCSSAHLILYNDLLCR